MSDGSPPAVTEDRADGVAPASERRRPPGRVVVAVIMLATASYLVWLVVTHLTDIDRAVIRFQGAKTRWLVAAIILEVGSQAFAVVVQHRLLRRAGSTMGVFATARLVLVQNAIGLAVPGGPAVASVYSYRHIRRRGTNPSAAGWVVAASSVVGMLALATWGAFTATGTSWLSVLAGTLLVTALTVLVVLARSPRRLRQPMIALVRLIDRVRSARRAVLGPEERIDRFMAKLDAVHLGWRDWMFIAFFAVAVVAADCAVWICASHAIIAPAARCARPGLTARALRRCATFHSPTTAGLLVAYSAGQAALAIPLLPGGVGLVESLMTATLTATRVGAIPALSAVLLYRLISVWGVVVLGGVVWLIMQANQRRSARHI